MKTLNRWKSIFLTAGFGLLILLFFHWLAIPDDSHEMMLNRRIVLCIAVVFLVAALVLRIVKKAIEEEREQD